MKDSISQQFEDELRSFFALTLLNLVFGAMAMAFGMQFIVAAALALSGMPAFVLLPVIQIIAGGILFVLGLRWILSSVRIFSGVARLRREYRGQEKSGSDHTLTGYIVRMLAQYRENQETIQRMTLICLLGGCLFLALGSLNLVQGFSAVMSAGGTDAVVLSFVAAGINLTIGLVCLLSSAWFRTYARAWDLRLLEISRSEEALQRTLEQG
jgi:uncharacterized membrane protein